MNLSRPLTTIAIGEILLNNSLYQDFYQIACVTVHSFV